MQLTSVLPQLSANPGKTQRRPQSEPAYPRASGVSLLSAFHVFLWLCLFAPAIAFAQEKPDEAQPTGRLLLEAKHDVDGKQVELKRERFYLIKGSLKESQALKALFDTLSKRPFPTRKCYYQRANASAAFIKWLVEADCESVYCRPIDLEYTTGPKVVREFKEAYDESLNKYRSAELAQHWLTNYLKDNIRDGFYRKKQDALKALLVEVEVALKTSIDVAQTTAVPYVDSVMTDGQGQATFTDLTFGKYIVSNLIPTEDGDSSILWICEVEISSAASPLNISSKSDECVVIKDLLPVCDANKQTTSIK